MNSVSYDVPWGAHEPLARESHTMFVHSAPAFEAQPTSSDVHNRLSITFVAPVSHCSVCDVDEAISEGGSYTIFKVGKPFLTGIGKPTQACGREPCFHEVRRRRNARAGQIFLDVEALLVHLFRHKNTDLHVAKRSFLVLSAYDL